MVVEEFDLTDTSVEQECFGWVYKAKVFDSSEMDCTCVCVWCVCVGGGMWVCMYMCVHVDSTKIR